MQHPKNRHLCTISQLFLAISSQLRHVPTIRRKLVKQQYLLHMSPQYGELRPTNGWDRLAGLGHPSKFQRVYHLGFVTAATSLTGGHPDFARCLANCWAGTLYIHFRGAGRPSRWASAHILVWCVVAFDSSSWFQNSLTSDASTANADFGFFLLLIFCRVIADKNFFLIVDSVFTGHMPILSASQQHLST